MKQMIEQYGSVILAVIVGIVCLTMYANVWVGSDSMISHIGNSLFYKSTSDQLTVNTTVAGDAYIIQSDGTLVKQQQQQSASNVASIQNRLAPTMQALGNQNSNQALIGQWYKTTDLMRGLSDNGNGVLNKPITTLITDSNKTITSNYFRVLSVTLGNGDCLISDLSNLNGNDGIAYSNKTYANKVGAAGSNSKYANNRFVIYTADNEALLEYDVANQKWYFYKAGAYSFRCFIVDEKGKSATSTVHIAVNRSNTTN